MEGYRTLGLVSTFIAGVESQCLGLLSGESNHSGLGEAASALLLIGLSLSALGAALSLLAARWFDLLTGDQIIMLEYRWACAQSNRKRSDPEAPPVEIDIPKEIQGNINTFKWNWRDYLVAKAVGSAVIIVFCGFLTFIVGMVIYTWMAHSLITAIANTIVATLGTFLLVCMHLHFEVTETLQIMSFKRITLPV